MNIFNKVALQGLKKSRTRTLVTIIGVILSAAMITAVITFGVTLLNYMKNGAISKYGDWHVAFLDVNSSFVQKQIDNDEVANTATFKNIGYAALDGGKNPEKPYLFIAGFSEEAFDTLPITLASGRLPENSGEILVSGKVSTDGGVKFAVGDTLSLAVGSRMSGKDKLDQSDPYTDGSENLVTQDERNYKVVGICRRPVFEESSAPGYTLITKADEQVKTDSFSMFITLKNPHKVHSYISSIKDHAYVLNDNVLRFIGISDNNLFNIFMYSFGGIVLAIIMIGSIFLIYNSFNMSLNERMQQFGILSSVGATEKQLRNLVLFEGLCIGAIGIPIGVIVGISSISVVISVVAKKFASVLYLNIPLTLTLSTTAIIVAAVVSMVTILISAYIPARKASSTPVMECIRQTNEVKIESKAVKTSNLIQRICGLEGTLALKNFKRNKKRYRSIVLSLILSIVLFISTSVLVVDLKQMSNQTLEFTEHDIIFSTQNMKDSEMLQLYDKFKTANGVYEGLYQECITYSSIVKTSELTKDYLNYKGSYSKYETANLPVNMHFLDDSTYLNIIKDQGLPTEEYTGKNAKMIAVSMIEGVDDTIDIFKSSSTNVTLIPEIKDQSKMVEGQNVDITFVKIVPPDCPPSDISSEIKQTSFMVLAPYSMKNEFVSSDISTGIKSMSFKSKNPTQSVAEMEKIIMSEGVTSQYNLYNMYGLMDDNRNYIFIANVFAYTFISMISLITVANVFNTISTNIKLRRRELAMLRSVGMSEHDFQKMMNFECIFYGARALLFGLPIAIITSWLIHKVMVTDDIDFMVPWGSIGISVFGVLFIVFITMLYTINKIKKENIIDALRDDMS
ncbi:FtsX-like permease family protein [Clostridium senegalense]|uniref:ABC transporter permease n=1 Tax=Clostridium senegalense TaxID=1465809 RepID=UPI001C11E251|nr:FtsX-like permease family protein [Clostridium senegalense]MBU5226379.1 FtsX-like permease family protein [Clostridium senegalense]